MANGYIVISDFHHSELAVGDDEWKSICEVSVITPNLYISNWRNGTDIDVLKHHGIKCILSISEGVKSAETLQRYKDNGIEHKALIIEDNLREDLSKYFNDIWDYISLAHSLKKRVLVHCSYGKSRSPAAVLYYLVRRLHTLGKLSKTQTDTTYKLLLTRRSCIEVNPDFLNQVREYEHKILGLPFVPVKTQLFDSASMAAAATKDESKKSEIN